MVLRAPPVNATEAQDPGVDQPAWPHPDPVPSWTASALKLRGNGSCIPAWGSLLQLRQRRVFGCDGVCSLGPIFVHRFTNALLTKSNENRLSWNDAGTTGAFGQGSNMTQVLL